jgi:hypothetical protein
VGYDYTVTYNPYVSSTNPGNNSGTYFNAPSCINTNVGHFKTGHKYRITYATWSSTCPWTQVSATMYMCNGGCRMSSPEIVYGDVTTENTTLYGAQYQSSMMNHQEINIFPNPNNGSFTLAVNSSKTKNIFVYDMMGKLVYSIDQTTDSTIPVDLTNQPDGVYFVRVVMGDAVVTEKLVKQ